ncbi:diguanylate cyclase [Stappia sp. F7233]|uniref:Diguanylate cyclase n=1 Tax=Stappia albiluteola TaxID=2758565 RepID=A0A839AJ29_9HYPH|nr:diguanylate cyclase [Stappia albiluteola]MBA5779038.1 diguanylate cyclase [Stappia albiluteola]
MQDLEVSTATLVALFAEFDDAVFVTGADRRIIYVNHAAEKMFGYGADEMVGRDPAFLYASQDEYQRFAAWRDAAEGAVGGDRLRLAARRRKSGDVFRVDVTSGALRDDKGEVRAYVVIARDMTWQLKLEAEKSSALNRLEEALESLNEGFAYFDADDRLVLCNERYRQFYPRSSGLCVPGTPFRDILMQGLEAGEVSTGGRSRKAWLEDRLAAHRSPSPAPVEQQLADGRWLLVNERRTRDGGVAGVRTDITALKQAEARARQAELRLRVLNDSLPCFIGELAKDQTIRSVNEFGALWYGRTSHDLIGRKMGDFVAADFMRTVRPYFDAACAGEVQRFIATLDYPDGITRDVDVCYTPDFNDKGQVEAVFVYATDISHLKTIERVLQGLYTITSSRQLDAQQKIEAVLRLGSEAFGLANGLVARVEGDEHEVEFAVSQDGAFKAGQKRPADRTYCGKVLAADAPLAVEFAGLSDFSMLPSYEEMALEAYIGAPLVVDGETYGTVCFCSSLPRSKPFGDTDKEILRLFSDWIAHEIGRERDIRQLQEAQAELRRLATTDDLTGVLNRREFIRRTEQEMARAKRTGMPFALAIMDIDHFKEINDTLGHLAGDRVLQEVANQIRQVLRPYDIFGRIGGEEFCVALPSTSIEEATAAAERLREAVTACHQLDGDMCTSVTISVGVAVVLESDAGVTAVLSRADTALYKAKDRGRNQVVVADAAKVDTLLKPIGNKHRLWGD